MDIARSQPIICGRVIIKNSSGELCMAQNHYVTKPKRRNKNSNRKDPSKATMAKLRAHAAAETKAAGK
jgi:hypothetical protein